MPPSPSLSPSVVRLKPAPLSSRFCSASATPQSSSAAAAGVRPAPLFRCRSLPCSTPAFHRFQPSLLSAAARHRPIVADFSRSSLHRRRRAHSFQPLKFAALLVAALQPPEISLSSADLNRANSTLFVNKHRFQPPTPSSFSLLRHRLTTI